VNRAWAANRSSEPPPPTGRRRCDRCGSSQVHRCERCLTPFGRRAIAIGVLATVTLLLLTALAGPPGAGAANALTYALAIVVGIVLGVIGWSSTGYRVTCATCGHVTERLAPPRFEDRADEAAR